MTEPTNNELLRAQLALMQERERRSAPARQAFAGCFGFLFKLAAVALFLIAAVFLYLAFGVATGRPQ